MADKKMYKVGITVKEPWSADISYEVLDITLYAVENGGDGCSYIAIRANQGITPGTDDTVWVKATQRGQSIYDLAVKYGDFEGTEAEFEAEYEAALHAAQSAAQSASEIEAQVETNEAARVTAERARSDAETARSSAETARINAENARNDAEGLRDTAESDRVRAEAGRVTAEASRVEAETFRQGAEQSRRQQFEGLKADMETAIENVDAKSAEIAEDIEGYEANEAGRVSAENARAIAESARVSAEQSRVSAEQGRATAETQRAEQAASDHTRAENDHTRAESDHTRTEEAAAAAEHMVDIKQGPQGPQGNTGSSVDYPYELVNNLTTDDATKGLSAAQGVVLDGKVSQLGQEVNVDIQNTAFAETYIQPINYELGNISIIVSTNTWTYSNSNTRVRTPEGYALHLFPGDTIGLSNYANARFYIGWRKLDGSSGGAKGWLTSDYAVTEEGIYCVLVCNAVDTVQTSAEALGSLINVVRNTTLSKRVSELEGTQNGIEVLPESAFTLFQDNAYINHLGSLQSSTSFKVVTFSARKGDYILLSANNSAAVSCFAKESGGTNYNSLLVGSGNADYRYIAQTDSTIYISINKVAANNLVVIRNEQYRALMDAEDKNGYFNILAFCGKTHAYVKYSDGSINTTGSNIWAYTFLTDGVKKVRVFVTGEDNVAAAIAFYSSESASASSYIGGVQMLGNTGGGRWYEAEVPSGAITAIVTNHHGFVANPYILVDYVSKDLLGLDDDEGEMPELGIGIVYGYQKAENYDGTFSPLYTLNSYFPRQAFQSRIRLTPLYGIRLNIKRAGVLTIVKATGVLTENCVMTTIKAFTTTKTGWQVLLFDAPVTLSESESLGVGVNTDTAQVVVDSVYGGANAVTTDYLHYTQNVWQVYQQNLLIDVLGIPKNDAGEALTKAQSLGKRDVFAGNNPFRFNGPFYAHLFLDKIYQDSTDIIIPSESLDDIRVSRRLGFNVIEANVHTTSDGKFVVIHGASGKFGYEVTDLNGDFTYADTTISSKSLSWIKDNIRYRSDIPRYRTAIPTLKEFLVECRLNGMIPFCQASTAQMVALLDGIMGYGNYIAYNGTRALTNAPICEYKSLATKAEILASAREKGVPYIYSMANMASFTDSELEEIVQSLHAEGFMIATAYTTPTSTNRAIRAGFDIIAAGYQVNDFDANYGLFTADADWDDFATTGTITNDGVSMTYGKTIAPANAPSAVFLSKGLIRVTFTGELVLNFAGVTQTITSDGTQSMMFSSYIINDTPTFQLSGTSNGATITDLVFKVSKC